VRTPKEFAEKHIPEAINIDHEVISTEIDKLHLSKDQKIILYCRTGRRSGLALEALKKRGFTEVENYGSIDEAWAHLKIKAEKLSQ
jgi:phage shock protein E